jgi:hypothetical protein
MHAITVESLEVVFPKSAPRQSALSAPVKADFDQNHARVEACLWKSGVSSELSAKFETTLLAVLGALALGATGYGIEAVVGFANNNAMVHAVTALLQ